MKLLLYVVSVFSLILLISGCTTEVIKKEIVTETKFQCYDGTFKDNIGDCPKPKIKVEIEYQCYDGSFKDSIGDCPEPQETKTPTSTQIVKTLSCPNLVDVTNYVGYSETIGKFNIPDTRDQLFDGWKLKGTASFIGDIFTPCVKGSSIEENINQYYCRDMTANKIDSKGNIVDTKKVTVVLSLYFNRTLGKTTKKDYITTLC